MPRKVSAEYVRLDLRLKREEYDQYQAAAYAMGTSLAHLTAGILSAGVEQLPMLMEAHKRLMLGDFTGIAQIVTGQLDQAYAERGRFLATVRDGDESSLSEEGKQAVKRYRRRLKKQEATASFAMPEGVKEGELT